MKTKKIIKSLLILPVCVLVILGISGCESQRNYRYSRQARQLMSGDEVSRRHYQQLLFTAAEEGYQDTIDLIIRIGGDLNVRDLNGRTALMVAVENNRGNIVRTLLRQNVEADIADNSGRTALDYSRSFHISNMIREHLKK